jgi:hypothetical protein
VDAHAELLGGAGAALVRRKARVRQERQKAVVEPELAARHVEQRRVPSVTVEEDETPRRRGGRAAADVVQHGQERGR